MIRKITVFLIYFSVFSILAKAQINLSFVNYLSKNNLQREHLAYLNNLPNTTTPDSLFYLKTKYYLQYFNDTSFFYNYSNCKHLFASDSNAFNNANIFFLQRGTPEQSRWFGDHENQNRSFVSKSIYYVYTASISPLTISEINLPTSLQKDFSIYKKNYKKKPLMGAVLSAAVPGLGKLYVKKPRSFATTLFTHLIYGVESYESIKKLGIKNPYSIFSVSLFSVFYIANVYSGYRDVIQIKKETKRQFLLNAHNYYNFNYSYNAN